MRKFGLIGYPLGHSFSKKYFTEKFLKENIKDSSYDLYPLKNLNEISGLIENVKELQGLNVTIPYKSGIIQYLDHVEPEAVEVGAVNVLKIKRSEGGLKIFGYNSDVAGIADTLAPYLNDRRLKALVLGTGGSSKAVCHVLRKTGIPFEQVSRKQKKNILTYSDLTSEMIKRSHLIINTTPLGMYPDIDSKPSIDYSSLSPAHILFDLVYNPEMTSFMKMGVEYGSNVVGGLKMLYSQAERSWEIWNDPGL